MNKAKLTALCAKAQGWQLTKDIDGNPTPSYYLNGNYVITLANYNPIDNTSQADDLLEYVADKLKCDWELFTEHFPESEGFPRKRYYCLMAHHECCESAETQKLAKVLCALRASPEVTDAEINDAMDKAKLIALCAKVMGLSPAEQAAICYDPLYDANQADALLEYVASDRDWVIEKRYGQYHCRFAKSPDWEIAETQKLAKVLCSLRASPEVTDAEINDATTALAVTVEGE